MRYTVKTIVLLMAFVLLLDAISIPSMAVSMPEKVRIGLFYEKSSVTSFKISADKGLQLGYITKGNNFISLYEDPSNNTVTIRKDGYFFVNDDIYNEYNPTDKNIPEGDRLGPYHIQIGSNLSGIKEASEKVLEYNSRGIKAYQVYSDGWRVWTGFYTDSKAAQNDADKFSVLLGRISCNVVQPSVTRILCLSAQKSILLMFDSASADFQIHPRSENVPYLINVNGRRYRGDIEVIRFKGSDMTVINIVPFEEYLYGVVPSEIGANSHIEALKAQAVVSRTYVVNNLGKYKKWNFNLCNSTESQVYKGYDGETAITNKAVDDTKEKILTYNGNSAWVYYGASNGGITEEPKNVWNSEVTYPYIKSFVDPYDPMKEYTTLLTSDNIKTITKGELGNIVNVEVTKRAESGRVIELIISGTNGQKKTYYREACRRIFGLKSQLYTISTDADIIIKGGSGKAQLPGKKVITAYGVSLIKGLKATVIGADGKKRTVQSIPTVYIFTQKGYGHAVGMSQEGAKVMAKAGKTYIEILKFYFSGTEVE